MTSVFFFFYNCIYDFCEGAEHFSASSAFCMGTLSPTYALVLRVLLFYVSSLLLRLPQQLVSAIFVVFREIGNLEKVCRHP